MPRSIFPKSIGRALSGKLGALPMLAGVIVLFAILAPNFLTAANAVNVVRQASINLVLAAGMTFVILTGGIDLSVGSVLGVTAVLSVLISQHPAWAWAAVPASLGAGLVVGALTGALIALGGMPPFIVTLGTFTALRGAAYLLANGTTLINADLSFGWIGNDYLGPVPWLVVVASAVIIVSEFVLRFTVLGMRIYAVGGNREAARLTGINVTGILVVVYSVSGILASLGGVMSASRLYSANGQLGTGYELDAIAAVILGGTSFAGGVGSVFGTLNGALIIAVLTNGLTLLNLSYFWQLVVKGGVIVVAVGLDRWRARRRA